MRVWISRISTSATGDITQIVNDRLGISASCSETNVAIWADQDQRVTDDAVGVGGMSIALDQGVVSDRGRAPYTCDGVGAQGVIGDIRQRWYGLVTENEQGEVCAPEEIEEPDLFA